MKMGKQTWTAWKRRWFEFDPTGERLFYYDVQTVGGAAGGLALAGLKDLQKDLQSGQDSVDLERQARATLSEMVKEPAPAFENMNEKGCIEVTAITSVHCQTGPPPAPATGGVVDSNVHAAQHIVTVETNIDRGPIKLRASTAAQAVSWAAGINCAIDDLQQRHLRRVEALKHTSVAITDAKNMYNDQGDSFTVYDVAINSLNGGAGKLRCKRYSDFHALHKQIKDLGEIPAVVVEAAAFPEKNMLSSMFTTRGRYISNDPHHDMIIRGGLERLRVVLRSCRRTKGAADAL